MAHRITIEEIARVLVGRRIVAVRGVWREEFQELAGNDAAIVLDDGTEIEAGDEVFQIVDGREG